MKRRSVIHRGWLLERSGSLTKAQTRRRSPFSMAARSGASSPSARSPRIRVGGAPNGEAAANCCIAPITLTKHPLHRIGGIRPWIRRARRCPRLRSGERGSSLGHRPGGLSITALLLLMVLPMGAVRGPVPMLVNLVMPDAVLVLLLSRAGRAAFRKLGAA